MNFYTINGSPNSRKVHAVLNYLGIDATINALDIFAGELDTPEVQALNPNGMIPILEDGNFILWESNAIMQYLADSVAESDFYPRDPRQRADIHRWQCWELAHFNRATSTILFEKMLKPMLKIGEPDEAKITEATANFHQYAKVLDAHLADKNFMLGDKLTIADFSVAAFSGYFADAGIPVGNYPNLITWLERLDNIPAWADTPSLAA